MICSIINWEILFIAEIISMIAGVFFGYLTWGRKKK